MDDFQFKVPQGVLAPSSKKAKFDGTVSNNREMDAILDQAQGIDLLTRPKLEKLLRKVEAEIGTNQSLRMKHADDPLKYIDSEADLAEACKDLTRLSEQPGLYNYFIKQLQGHIVIGQLLAHPNTDIGISAIGLLNELTDDDVVSPLISIFMYIGKRRRRSGRKCGSFGECVGDRLDNERRLGSAWEIRRGKGG